MQSPLPQTPKGSTSDIRTPCADHSLEGPVVAWTQPSAGQEETAAEQLAGGREGKLGKSSHICPNKAHIYYQTDGKPPPFPPIPSHLIAYGT